jgi:hypothetical protein
MDPAYGAPYSAVDVVLLPGLCLIFAALFRFLAWTRERNNQSGIGMKRLAWFPLVFSLYLGGQYAWRMFEPTSGYVYRKSMETMVKVQIAHWLVIVLPIVALAVLLVWDRTERRLGRPIAI